MTTRLTTMSSGAPKAAKALVQTAATRKGTIQSDYMILADGGRLGAGEEAKWATIQANIIRTIGIQRQSDKRVRVTKSLGTIFGARRTGQWTFYYQQLVSYEVWRKAGMLSSSWQCDQGNLWYVADCREFWPNGGGHAV